MMNTDKVNALWVKASDDAENAEADHKAAEQNVSDLMAEVAQTGALLMKIELALTAAQNSDEHNFNRWQKAEADNQRLRKDCDEHARWRADLADKLHDAEASNKRLADENEQLREMGK